MASNSHPPDPHYSWGGQWTYVPDNQTYPDNWQLCGCDLVTSRSTLPFQGGPVTYKRASSSTEKASEFVDCYSAPRPLSMKIFIDTPKEERLALEISRLFTVAHVKWDLYLAFGIEKIRLYFNGVLMCDDDQISTVGLYDGCQVAMVYYDP